MMDDGRFERNETNKGCTLLLCAITAAWGLILLFGYLLV